MLRHQRCLQWWSRCHRWAQRWARARRSCRRWSLDAGRRSLGRSSIGHTWSCSKGSWCTNHCRCGGAALRAVADSGGLRGTRDPCRSSICPRQTANAAAAYAAVGGAGGASVEVRGNGGGRGTGSGPEEPRQSSEQQPQQPGEAKEAFVDSGAGALAAAAGAGVSPPEEEEDFLQGGQSIAQAAAHHTLYHTTLTW